MKNVFEFITNAELLYVLVVVCIILVEVYIVNQNNMFKSKVLNALTVAMMMFLLFLFDNILPDYLSSGLPSVGYFICLFVFGLLFLWVWNRVDDLRESYMAKKGWD